MSDITFSTWVHFVDLCGLPVRDELRETYDAASPYQAECLAAMWHAAMQTPPAPTQKNPFGLHNEGSFYGLSTFSSYVAAVQEWLRRGIYHHYTPTGTAPNLIGSLTMKILEHDALPVPDPPPPPERVTQPTEYDLRNWFCSNKLLKYDERVYAVWVTLCTPDNLFPELVRITEDERGLLHHFENGIKIIATPDTVGRMYC